MILNQLGIFGWKLADENLVLASLLTGDPLLLIGNHGCAKTHVANKVAQALGRSFLVYDASKAMFEDVLGYPNVERLKQGVVEYVSSPVTIWDKELVLIDELNRAVPELQSKWLEIIRSRRIMGFPTQVKWVWAAMNPIGYAGANLLDSALVGRFAFFLYPPDVLQMEEHDRIKVATHINGDDAPSLREWTGGATASTVSHEDTEEVGEMLRKLLPLAGQRFLQLRTQMRTLPEFLAKFADLLARETRGEVSLDGRRLGFVHRNLLANRAIELARADLFGDALPDFVQSARYVVQSSVPVALDGEGIKREEAVHKFEICFDLLAGYFAHNAELGLVNLVYELFTTKDLMRRAELLLTEDLGELALTKAWSDLLQEKDDITLLAYTALQVEARRPGTVPRELLSALSGRMGNARLSTDCIPRLEDDDVEYIDEVEALLRQDTELGALVAYGEMAKLASTGHITPERLAQTRRRIKEGILAFEALLDGKHQKGDIAA